MIARLKMDTNAATWRGRAMRYVLIYLLLTLVLVGMRYATQNVRVELRAAAAREEELIVVRDELEVRVQALTTPQRIREWAFSQGMRRFAETPKVRADMPVFVLPARLNAPGSAAASAPQTRLEVRTQWR